MEDFGKHRPASFPGLPGGWSVETGELTATDDRTRLFTAMFRKDSVRVPSTVLFVLHGYGEHCERYLHLPHYLCRDVDLICLLDHRGHGRSGGRRGHMDRFDDYAHDAARAIRAVEKKLAGFDPRPEIHLLGHSMGGHIALRTAFLHPELPIRSLILSAPYLELSVPVPALKVLGAAVLSRLWKTAPLDVGIHADILSHDPAVVDSYVSDPLVHSIVTPGLFATMRAAQSDTLSRATGIRWPTLLLLPGDDRLVDSAVTRRFFDSVKLDDGVTPKEIRGYDGFYHELMNERGKERVFADLCAWLEGCKCKK